MVLLVHQRPAYPTPRPEEPDDIIRPASPKEKCPDNSNKEVEAVYEVSGGFLFCCAGRGKDNTSYKYEVFYKENNNNNNNRSGHQLNSILLTFHYQRLVQKSAVSTSNAQSNLLISLFRFLA